MRTVTVPVCEACGSVIVNSEDGFIVQGNIYTGDLDSGGLIGNAFPNQAEVDHFVCDGEITPARFSAAVRKVCYCKKCFFEALNIAREVKRGG